MNPAPVVRLFLSVLLSMVIGGTLFAGDSVTLPTISTTTISSGTAGVTTALNVSSVPSTEYVLVKVSGDFVPAAGASGIYSSNMAMELNNGGSTVYRQGVYANSGIIVGSETTSWAGNATLTWYGLLSKAYVGGTALSVRFYSPTVAGYTAVMNNVVVTLHPMGTPTKTFTNFDTAVMTGGQAAVTKTLDTTGMTAPEYAFVSVSADFTPAVPSANSSYSSTIQMEINNGGSTIFYPSARATLGQLENTNATTLRWIGVMPTSYTGGTLSVAFKDGFNGPYTSSLKNVSVSMFPTQTKKVFTAFNAGTLTGGSSVTKALDVSGMPAADYVFASVTGSFTPASSNSAWSETIRMELNNGGSTVYYPASQATTGWVADTSAVTLRWDTMLPRTYVGGGALSVKFSDTFATGSPTSEMRNVVVTLHPTYSAPIAITSLTRVNATPSNAATANWTLTFPSAVTGVTASNFSLSPTVTGATIGTPSTSNGGVTWNVPVSGITGDGTLQLNVTNATGLSRGISNTLPYSGASYLIDRTAPTISIGAPSLSLTKAGPVSYTVTYSDTNFSASSLVAANVTLIKTGSANGSVAVTGTNPRTVTISGITGSGTLGISIIAGTATDTAGNTAPAAGATTTFVVDNIAPSITSNLTAGGTYQSVFTSYTITASDSPFSYDATGLPNGLTRTGAVISGTPTQTGTFSVTISATDAAGNTGTATLAITIAKATATVTLAGLNQTYTGSARTVTATTSPASLTVGFTYNGSGTAPTAAGSYPIVGTISDTNYQGSASGTLVVSKATATVTLAGLTQTYNGSARTVTATTSPASLTVGFTYNGSGTAPTAAGSYPIVGTISDTNYQGSASGTLVVSKATATVTLAGLTQTYNGSARTVTATTSPASLTVGFTYNGSGTAPTAAGSYPIVGTINDTNYQGSANGTLEVSKPVLTVKANDFSRAYGAANPTLTAGITGFVGGETEAVITGAPALSTPANAASIPGDYQITAAAGTLAATNYSFAYTNGTLTVDKQAPSDWNELHFTEAELEDPAISGPLADADNDGIPNLIEMAFGTDPRVNASGPSPLVYTGTLAGGGTITTTGQPVSLFEPSGNGVDFRAVFIRRNPALSEGLVYTPQFSADMNTWQNSSATPVVLATNGDLEMASVPYPLFVAGRKARFFRITVSLLP